MPPQPTAANRNALAVICCVAMLFYAFYLGAFGVLLPFIGASFRLGSAVSGRLFPADFAGFVAGVLLCGALSDRLGRKTVLLSGVAIYAVGLALFGVASNFPLGLFATALLGAGSGAMETVASALASDLFPERRAFLLNAIQIAFGAGAAVSPLLAHALLIAGTDWRTLYLGLAALNIGLFLALALQPVPRPQHGEALDFAALGAVLRQPAFLALCLAQALYVGAETGFFSWMPTYFQKRLPEGATWEGLVLALFWIAMTIGRIATGMTVSRLPLLKLTALLAFGGAVGSLLALARPSPLWVLVFVFWTGLCFSGIFGLILAEAGERYPNIAGTAFGGIVAAGGVGGAVMPWTVGALAATSLDWRGALLLIPTLSVLLALVVLWVRRN